ncbi:TonB-dependent receptor [Granulicella sibirica]|uniref:Oar protein n=1 Tax=Granulicella sibirica TaxID=2479048 RepID=A0A4Q0T9D9_9BACT|nr:TonB-dependent receptor [Granulicella sibirica]RXH58366.1 Oar protein [Granulicella sibirica]
MKKFFPLALAAAMSFGVSFGPAAPISFAQAVSTNGGSIQGTITDPSNAVLSKASIDIRGIDTGFTRSITTDSAGFYSIGPLNPGTYEVSVSTPGFQKLVVTTVVRTGTATSGNFKLSVGQSSETIEVTAGELQVNTEQAGVSDVLTNEQIQHLPINGRNFLDIAQIEPGVILQSGESFDPTKAGYSAISVGGVSGRTTRILLDGQDITDETVGTTIFNVSQGSISEFQLNRSTQDVSGDITSTGQVLVASQSGTNRIHGQAFYNFQDYRAVFADVQGQKAPFQRNQFGGSAGGPIFKDKLFFFGNIERIKQDSATPISIGSQFPQYQGLSLTTPYKETYSVVRLDYNGPLGGHYFVRGNYNVNSVASAFGDGFQRYANRDNTPGIAGGADFQTGRFTHSFRGSYEKFHNLISDASGGIFNLLPGITFENVVQNLYTGPNDLAPQGTFQSDKQFRYDGSWTKGRQSFKYGYSLNRIQGGGFAAFFGLAPRIRETSGTAIGDPTDAINGYHASSIVLGNGLGFFTEHSGFGLIGGGVGDWREGAYISDTIKLTSNFTLNAGVRWSVDTGRANQDLATPNCSDISSTLDPSLLPCTGSTPLFSAYNPSFTQSHVHQPYGNFAPQIGFAYAPGNHKTVLTGAYGIFFEGDVFNNTTNARTGVIKQGAFFNDKSICASGNFVQPDGTVVNSATVGGVTRSIASICSGSVASAAPYAIALQQLYQQNSAANATSANGAYIGQTLDAAGIYAPNYKTPYSQQWNFGIQHEIAKGAILRADYIHNSTIKISQETDLNHLGASRYLNVTAAKNAIAATTAAAGCAGGSSQAAINCTIAAAGEGAGGANILGGNGILQSFAGNGLDSGANFNGGLSAGFNGVTPNTGAAFPGQNQLLGSGAFLQPIGRSGYDALQVVFRQAKSHPFKFVDRGNIQVSYNLSRIVSSSNNSTGDQFFSGLSYDNDNPNAYIGRANLDHKHQVSFGGSFTMKYGPQIGIVGHFSSAAPTTLLLDNPLTTGNIFQTDVTGDGTVADLVPGTLPGDYMHRVKPTNLGAFIQNFNNTHANQLTPAGQALVAAGLFTQQQLVAIGAAIQPIATLPQARALGNPSIRGMDLNFSYPIRLNRFREGMSLEPAIAFYNVGNFSNFDPSKGPSGTLQNVADGGDGNGGTVNTLTGNVNGLAGPGAIEAYRVGRGSGTFDQGGPRSTEFQLKLNF